MSLSIRPSVRGVASSILQKVLVEKAYTNLALKEGLQDVSFSQRDKALCTELVYGTVQRLRTIDTLLQPYSQRKLHDLDAEILTILRMTLYQIAFLTKIPNYAAIHEAVEAVKRIQVRAAGFVNGVLRAFLRDPRTIAERIDAAVAEADTWAGQMGIRHSYPTWMVERLAKRYGKERTEQILLVGNARGYLSLRVNLLQTTVDEMIAQINAYCGADCAIPSPISPFGIRVLRGIDVEQLPSYQEGKITVQDEGAMLISPLLHPVRGEQILDMCAAPGTKTTHIAELMHDEGRIDACDIHLHKLKFIRQARNRLQLSSIETRLSDARVLSENQALHGAFDRILLDAPCSGLGVLRHRPDIRWRRKPTDIVALQQLQIELLQTAATLVKPGGVIVYATCTLLPDENEMVVERVIQDSRFGLQLDPIDAYLPSSCAQYLSSKHEWMLTPELANTDGFYMARLKKSEKEIN